MPGSSTNARNELSNRFLQRALKDNHSGGGAGGRSPLAGARGVRNSFFLFPKRCGEKALGDWWSGGKNGEGMFVEVCEMASRKAL